MQDSHFKIQHTCIVDSRHDEDHGAVVPLLLREELCTKLRGIFQYGTGFTAILS